MGDITKNYIFIGWNNAFNVFYMSIINFYTDGGVVGVILFLLLLEIIT